MNDMMWFFSLRVETSFALESCNLFRFPFASIQSFNCVATKLSTSTRPFASEMLRTLIVPARVKQTASCIFLHGFGATCTDWQLLSEVYGAAFSHIKWIFPQAPMRPITIANGESIPAWFDILYRSHDVERTKEGGEDELGMNQSISQINALVEAEIAGGIKSDRIIVGGFSQGAALSLLEGVTGKMRLGGVIVLSGYAPLLWKLAEMKVSRSNTLPVFMAHGEQDTVINMSVGRAASTMLKQSGMSKIEYHEYPNMEHGYCNEELRDLGHWLLQHLPAKDDYEPARL